MKSVLILALFAATMMIGRPAPPAPTIICPKGATPNLPLAAPEVRRYVWLRTGTLLPIHTEATGTAPVISFTVDSPLADEQFRLKSRGNSLAVSAEELRRPSSASAINQAIVLRPIGAAPLQK